MSVQAFESPSYLKRTPAISSPVLGMLIFILTEMMIFASFFSAFNIVKSGFTNWPPMGQPTLPVMATAFNSLFLLASAPLLIMSYRFFVKGQLALVKKTYIASCLCGFTFFALQGVEWVKLISFGLTVTSSVYGSFFYLIIGAHALHVFIALMVLFTMYRRLTLGTLSQNSFASAIALWIFVVGVWPVLYVLVYL